MNFCSAKNDKRLIAEQSKRHRITRHKEEG